MKMANQAREFMGLVRAVQMEEIKAQIALSPLLLIVADETTEAQRFAFALAGAATPDEEAARATTTVAMPEALASLAVGPAAYDAIILIDPSPETRRDRNLQALIATQRQTAILAIYTQAPASPDPGLPGMTVTGLTDPAALRAVRSRLVAGLPAGRRLAWGRTFAGFRGPIADLLVEQTARANAQFALMADLGARIPILGGIAATGADFLVLTRNQLVLAYQLAAINGRDLDDPRNVVTSAAPFFLAGLGWREVARRAIRLVPGVPLVPKVVIAYGGTLLSGSVAKALSNPEGVRAWVEAAQAGAERAARPGGPLGTLRRGATNIANNAASTGRSLRSPLPHFSGLRRDKREPVPESEIGDTPPVTVVRDDDPLPRR